MFFPSIAKLNVPLQISKYTRRVTCIPQVGNPWIRRITASLFGHKKFVWWLHIAELTHETAKETCNCRYKRVGDRQKALL